MKQKDYDHYFSGLYEKHFNRVVKYLLSIVHDFFVAEDIAHDVFFRFYQKRVQIDGDQRRVASYVLKSAKNRALDYLRTERRRHDKYCCNIPEISGIDEILPSEIENCYICGEIVSTVEDVLHDFPERTRKIFIEMVEGKKLIDVSDDLSISRYMTKKDYEKVCRAMRERLKIYRE